MILEPLTRDDAEQVRLWRNSPEILPTLRTPKELTYDEQQQWYTDEIANRESKTRYWAIIESEGSSGNVYTCDRIFYGYGGIEHIEWENRRGEISIMLDPERWGEGIGSEAVWEFLRRAFNRLNLDTVWGECYTNGPWGFWEKMVAQHDGVAVMLPCKKYWDGEYYDAYYFTFFKGRTMRERVVM